RVLSSTHFAQAGHPSCPTRRSSDLAQRRGVAVAGQDDRVVAEAGEDPLLQVVHERVEVLLRPGLARSAGEERITGEDDVLPVRIDRKSTRLNSSHVQSSYAVFCLQN